MNKLSIIVLICTLTLGIFASVPSQQVNASPYPEQPGKVLADYAGEIREETPRADGIHHIDTPAMIERLKELNVNTYYYLIWHEKTDWDDLRYEFLPAAEAANINVVVYLVPPSESKGERKSYPYTTDYITWSEAIANLSLDYPNLIGWAIDDFSHNLTTYTPEYMAQMKETSEAINPDLFFTPQMYTEALTESFLETRGAYIDGVILAFRDGEYRNTQVHETAQQQIDDAYAKLNKYDLPLYWMIYASQLSRTPANPSANYVREVVQIALENMEQGKISGVITYVLKKNFEPQPTDDKAYNDKGYLNFFIGLGAPSSAGDYTEATQTVRVDRKSEDYSLTFQTMDHGPNVFGYHKKQLLIDGVVVWEQDTSEIVSDLLWEPVHVNLTPYLSGKSKVDITFRFYENKGVSNFWTYTGFDALEPVGFTVENGNFADNTNWEFSSNTRSVIGEILQYDEQRSLMAYHHTKVSYTTYKLYISIYTADIEQGIKNSLLAKADKIMDNHFAEQNEKATQGLNSLQSQINSLRGEEIPEQLAEKWTVMIQDLQQLYSMN
ncbi:hypothetical protein [Pseudalkalibacillus decolorationis]|uniref:hypothetical protein n=1 Tax=Pseudalkalibacillus decolorationis TaxID=163879 RepID=UPI0021483D6D|nr:hypothetical protein [Pseudalkalibacillus decolorationis]